jgi:hypothetical protein
MIATPSFAVTYGVGMSVNILWWQPYWTEGGLEMNKGKKKSSMDSATHYGPMLTAVFDRWTLTTSFRYGSYETKGNNVAVYENLIMVDNLPTFYSYNGYVNKYDYNLYLGYLLNKYMKIIGGIRYMGFSMNEKRSLIVKFSYYLLPVDARHIISSNTAGPSIGVGFDVPLMKDLYLLPKISWVMLWGNNYEGSSFVRVPKSTLMYYGFNTSLSLAYHWADIKTTFVLGYRAQILMIKAMTGSSYASHRSDLTQGIQMSAEYSFDL